MLKFSYLAQLGLAGTVLAPAVVLNQDPAGGLSDALANTRSTIESLEHLHTALTRGDYGQVATTLVATESPTGAARERDEHLSYLRDEVSRLQMRWDAFDAALHAKVATSATAPSATPDASPTTAPATGTSVAPSTAQQATTPTTTPVSATSSPSAAPFTAGITASTTGMNDLVRAELIERLNQPAGSAPTTAAQTKTAYEPTGFTAHAVRHGRACYKAGRYEDALVILGGALEISGARFWIACSLEKLGRLDEAIEAYEAVMQSPIDGQHAQHAERNRDFLVWKRGFDARITTTAAFIMPGDSK